MIDKDALARRKLKLISLLIAMVLCFLLNPSSYGQEHQHHRPGGTQGTGSSHRQARFVSRLVADGQ